MCSFATNEAVQCQIESEPFYFWTRDGIIPSQVVYLSRGIFTFCAKNYCGICFAVVRIYEYGILTAKMANVAKFFYDLSKLTLGIAVISQLVTRDNLHWNTVAMGLTTGVIFFTMACMLDKRGDKNEQR